MSVLLTALNDAHTSAGGSDNFTEIVTDDFESLLVVDDEGTILVIG